jgi:hypothetical protein
MPSFATIGHCNSVFKNDRSRLVSSRQSTTAAPRSGDHATAARCAGIPELP